MSATPKKPPASGDPRRPAPKTTPSASSTASDLTTTRSPSRMTTTAPVAMANGAARSVKTGTGTPVSARAAARKPAESDGALDDYKAEMQGRLDELQVRLQQAELASENSQKQAQVLRVKLDEALKEQGILEEQMHEQTKRVEDLQTENKDSVRLRRELEQAVEDERAAMISERTVAASREEEMQGAMHRMRESLAQREMRSNVDDERRPGVSRSSSFRSNTASPNPDASGHFAPPPGLQRSDSRSSSKLIMQKDKIIESLRLELAEAEIKLVDVENVGGGRQHDLEKQMFDVKMQNARLMEENESFQLLLSERTLNGDFTQSHVMCAESASSSRPSSSRQPNPGGASLADELGSHDGDIDESALGETKTAPSRLQAENSSLKDQNKALTLYINNIISRLLSSGQYEHILDKTSDTAAGPDPASKQHAAADTDKELPPPPSKDQRAQVGAADLAQGLLQRARSVMGSARPKRPMSTTIHSDQAPRSDEVSRPHEDQSRAPSIPLGRANSTTRREAHRRANSEWAAASVVTSMYRGPSPTLQGPASPGLSSPIRGNPFFAPQPIGPGMGSRAPSGTVPTIAKDSGNKENVAHRDSKIVHPPSRIGNRNSVISNPGSNAADPADAAQDGSGGMPSDGSNPSSPPRSTTSSSERESRNGPAVMMGSKMRPLRLVHQAAQEDEAAKKAANRGSWLGWMNGVVPLARGPGGEGGQ